MKATLLPRRLPAVAGRAVGCAAGAAIVLAVAVVATPTPASGTTVTVTAAADAYVRSDQAGTNFGSAVQLASNGSTTTTMVSYLRFDVTGLSGAVSSATLSYYSQSTGVTKTAVHPVTGSWAENTITYATRPAYGATISTTGALTAGTRASADVSAVVTGNGSYSFALTTTATATRWADSREAANPPQLLINFSTDPVVVLAGDIACSPTDVNFNSGAGVPGYCHMQTTVSLAQGVTPAAVLALGDEQYNSGNPSDFLASYDQSWGAVKAITRPVVGNHEYGTTGAGGYFGYFAGAATGGTGCLSGCGGYYSYDIGSWHIVAINTECSRIDGGVGCAVGSPQEVWLRNDLAAHPASCTLAYGHRPRWSSNSFASADIAPLISDLVAAGVDVYASGHSHSYERFAPMDAAGAASPTGLTQLVVGTGGSFFTGFGTVQPNSVVHKSNIFGVLRMTLHPGSYDWSFVPDASTPFSDSGTASCS